VLFTFENYRLLLETLLRRGLQNLTVADYLETRPTDDFFILRHDVEWNPDKALDVARLEISLGLRASYYFHGPNRQRVFNTRVMAEMQKMGHEIGYHYETLDRAGGDMRAARELFESDISMFRGAGLSLRTVAYHGNPRVKRVTYQHNGDMIKRDRDILRANQLLGEAYLSIDWQTMEHVSDVGVQFSTVQGSHGGVLEYLKSAERTRLYVLTHPDYWSRSAVRAFALQRAAMAMRASRPVAKAAWAMKDRVSR
jgi:hypothetical protein